MTKLLNTQRNILTREKQKRYDIQKTSPGAHPGLNLFWLKHLLGLLSDVSKDTAVYIENVTVYGI